MGNSKGGRPKCRSSMKATQTMNETKFLLYGQHHRSNGWVMNDCLCYLTTTAEEAVATCNKLYPHFVIQSIEIDESEVEVVKVQSLG